MFPGCCPWVCSLAVVQGANAEASRKFPAGAPRDAPPPRTLPSDEVDRHRFRLGVVLHHFLAHLAAPARLLEAAEGPGGIAVVMAVDADRAGLDLARERMGDLQIMGPDTRLEAIFGIVGEFGSLGEAFVVYPLPSHHGP